MPKTLYARYSEQGRGNEGFAIYESGKELYAYDFATITQEELNAALQLEGLEISAAYRNWLSSQLKESGRELTLPETRTPLEQVQARRHDIDADEEISEGVEITWDDEGHPTITIDGDDAYDLHWEEEQREDPETLGNMYMDEAVRSHPDFTRVNEYVRKALAKDESKLAELDAYDQEHPINISKPKEKAPSGSSRSTTPSSDQERFKEIASAFGKRVSGDADQPPPPASSSSQKKKVVSASVQAMQAKLAEQGSLHFPKEETPTAEPTLSEAAREAQALAKKRSGDMHEAALEAARTASQGKLDPKQERKPTPKRKELPPSLQETAAKLMATGNIGSRQGVKKPDTPPAPHTPGPPTADAPKDTKPKKRDPITIGDIKVPLLDELYNPITKKYEAPPQAYQKDGVWYQPGYSSIDYGENGIVTVSPSQPVKMKVEGKTLVLDGPPVAPPAPPPPSYKVERVEVQAETKPKPDTPPAPHTPGPPTADAPKDTKPKKRDPITIDGIEVPMLDELYNPITKKYEAPAQAYQDENGDWYQPGYSSINYGKNGIVTVSPSQPVQMKVVGTKLVPEVAPAAPPAPPPPSYKVERVEVQAETKPLKPKAPDLSPADTPPDAPTAEHSEGDVWIQKSDDGTIHVYQQHSDRTEMLYSSADKINVVEIDTPQGDEMYGSVRTVNAPQEVMAVYHHEKLTADPLLEELQTNIKSNFETTYGDSGEQLFQEAQTDYQKTQPVPPPQPDTPPAPHQEGDMWAEKDENDILYVYEMQEGTPQIIYASDDILRGVELADNGSFVELDQTQEAMRVYNAPQLQTSPLHDELQQGIRAKFNATFADDGKTFDRTLAEYKETPTSVAEEQAPKHSVGEVWIEYDADGYIDVCEQTPEGRVYLYEGDKHINDYDEFDEEYTNEASEVMGLYSDPRLADDPLLGKLRKDIRTSFTASFEAGEQELVEAVQKFNDVDSAEKSSPTAEQSPPDGREETATERDEPAKARRHGKRGSHNPQFTGTRSTAEKIEERARDIERMPAGEQAKYKFKRTDRGVSYTEDDGSRVTSSSKAPITTKLPPADKRRGTHSYDKWEQSIGANGEIVIEAPTSSKEGATITVEHTGGNTYHIDASRVHGNPGKYPSRSGTGTIDGIPMNFRTPEGTVQLQFGKDGEVHVDQKRTKAHDLSAICLTVKGAEGYNIEVQLQRDERNPDTVHLVGKDDVVYTMEKGEYKPKTTTKGTTVHYKEGQGLCTEDGTAVDINEKGAYKEQKAKIDKKHSSPLQRTTTADGTTLEYVTKGKSSLATITDDKGQKKVATCDVNEGKGPQDVEVRFTPKGGVVYGVLADPASLGSEEQMLAFREVVMVEGKFVPTQNSYLDMEGNAYERREDYRTPDRILDDEALGGMEYEEQEREHEEEPDKLAQLAALHRAQAQTPGHGFEDGGFGEEHEEQQQDRGSGKLTSLAALRSEQPHDGGLGDMEHEELLEELGKLGEKMQSLQMRLGKMEEQHTTAGQTHRRSGGIQV